MALDKPDSVTIQNAVDEARNEVRYLVTDFPVETLIQRYKEADPEEGDIYVPPYQRTLQWDKGRMSYFIESILLRVPVPPVFFYEVGGRLEIVDGSQRIRTLIDFVAGKFRLSDLETLDTLNGLRYGDLPLVVRKRFLNSPIRSFVLEEGTDETVRVELFRRVNTSSKQLSDAEIRKGSYTGPFLNLIIDCANRAAFRELAPGKGSRGNPNPESERQELVTRFFVYANHYKEFSHDVRKFLDRHLKRLNKEVNETKIAEMSAEFDLVMEFIHTHQPTAFFRTEKTKQVPRVRFEAISVGTCLALRERPSLVPTNFEWLAAPSFLDMIRTDASNSGPRLQGRIEYVRDQLLANP